MQNGELRKVLKKVEALFKHQFAQTIELKSSETATVTEREREREAGTGEREKKGEGERGEKGKWRQRAS